MACFVAPMAEAIVVTAVKKAVKKKEQKTGETKIPQTGISLTEKLSWLNNLLWGGVLLLALEHLWHGELVPWPPFLTAINTPGEVGPMLREIATTGTAMSIFVTMIWGIMVWMADRKSKAINKKIQAGI